MAGAKSLRGQSTLEYLLLILLLAMVGIAAAAILNGGPRALADHARQAAASWLRRL